jgi:hypothetical protein
MANVQSLSILRRKLQTFAASEDLSQLRGLQKMLEEDRYCLRL